MDEAPKKRKPSKPIIHAVQHLDIDIKQRGEKRRILRIQRYKQPVLITDIEIEKNPDKISFGVIRNDYGDRLELFAYKDNPETVFISLNGNYLALDKHKLREMVSFLTKGAWFIGLFGKRAKKYRLQKQYAYV